MPIPTVITDLSTTASSNYPDGDSESPIVLDDVQRAHAAFIAQLRDGKGLTTIATLASGTTTDIGGQNSFFVSVTGSVTITGFGTNYNGPRFLIFTGILTLTHAATLVCPGASNITTAANDSCIAIPISGGWQIVSYQRAAGLPAASGLATASGLTMSTARVLGRTTASTGAIEELEFSSIALPVGTIIDFAGTAAPTGYLACPLVATNISRTTYAALFAAIGTTWGAGDGSTTFGQPYFPADYAAGQANANVGTTTVGENLAHTHPIQYQSSLAGGINASVGAGQSAGTATDSSGGAANLAASMRVLKCVKYI